MVTSGALFLVQGQGPWLPAVCIALLLIEFHAAFAPTAGKIVCLDIQHVQFTLGPGRGLS